MTLLVAHIVRQYHPSVGGMEDVVRSIVHSQHETGSQKARIITLNRLFRNSGERLPATETVEGVPVIRLGWSGSSRYPLCPAVLGEIREADVVHVHGVDFFYDYLAITKFIHRKPLVLSTHGGFFHTEFASGLKTLWFRTITRWSARAYEKIVATSENDGVRFAEISPPEHLEVIENGVNTTRYANSGSVGLNQTLIYFGRWSANKGLREALELMARLTAREPGWRLLIAGREYDHSAAELNAWVDALGLQGVVELHPNPSDDQLRSLLGRASFFLCLSRHEGFGLAAIEAMSAGLTPVLSDIPPFRRLTELAGVGVAGPAADPDRLAGQTIRYFHEGQASHEQRRERAMTFAGQYSWPKVAGRYLQLYEQLGRKS